MKQRRHKLALWWLLITYINVLVYWLHSTAVVHDGNISLPWMDIRQGIPCGFCKLPLPSQCLIATTRNTHKYSEYHLNIVLYTKAPYHLCQEFQLPISSYQYCCPPFSWDEHRSRKGGPSSSSCAPLSICLVQFHSSFPS